MNIEGLVQTILAFSRRIAQLWRKSFERVYSEYARESEHTTDENLHMIRAWYLDQYRYHDSELRAAFADEDNAHNQLSPTETFDYLPPDDELIQPGTKFDDYTIVGVIGRGGGGCVYEAVRVTTTNDFSNEQRVALKVLPPWLHRGRFHVEAEALRRLDHPNIVSIYGIGEAPGRHRSPYLVTELIEGPDLHKQTQNGPLSPTDAANLALTLADAVQYAHEHDVLHRDIKPSNIILGKTLKLADFGIAKLLDRDTSLTATGHPLGTPSYMPPEHVTGSHNTRACGADIYGIGAVLYEMLTGRPPFVGKDAKAIYYQVTHDEPQFPRRFNKAISKDLEAVCLKCLSKNPNERYDGIALALAKDLRRAISGEPTIARPVNRLVRLGKLMKRNRAISVVIGLAVTAVLVTAAISAVTVIRESRRASRYFTHARKALDKVTTIVTHDEEMAAHGLEDLHEDLLVAPVEFYEAFTQEDPTNPRLQADLALACLRLAEIQIELGNHSKADSFLERSRRIFEERQQRRTINASEEILLADCYHLIGRQYWRRGNHNVAKKMHLAAIALRSKQSAAFSGDPKYVIPLAASYRALGNVLASDKHAVDLAASTYHNAISALVPFKDSIALALIADIWNDVGVLYNNSGKNKEAEVAWKKCLEISTQLFHDRPNDPLSERRLATAYNHFSNIARANKAFVEAEEYSSKAESIAERLVREHPAVVVNVQRLASIYLNKASNSIKQGQNMAVLDYCGKATELVEPLYKQHDDDALLRRTLRNAYFKKAEALLFLQRHTDAVQCWNRVIELDAAGGSSDPDAIIGRAWCFIRMQDWRKAVEDVNSVTSADLTHDTLYNVIGLVCLSSTAASRDPQLSPTEATRVAVELLDRAFEVAARLLQRSDITAEQISQFEHDLNNDTDLLPMHERKELFKQLLNRLGELRKSKAK